MSYTNADVCMITLASDSKTSLENASKKWYAEIKHYKPNIPCVFVCNKFDMYDEDDSEHVNPAIGKKVAATVNCEYFSCSAMT